MRTVLYWLILSAMLSSQSYYQIGAPSTEPKRIHIEGEKARTLISLLVTGNENVRAAIKGSNQTKIVIHELSILSEATQKYDPIDPYYRLMVYSARARIGSAASAVRIGEATALYEYFSELGLRPDVALEGTYLQVREINCEVNVNASVATPIRFQCDVTPAF
jgi:hypothetical protein